MEKIINKILIAKMSTSIISKWTTIKGQWNIDI